MEVDGQRRMETQRTTKVDGQGQNRLETALQRWTHRKATENQEGGRTGWKQTENDGGRQMESDWGGYRMMQVAWHNWNREQGMVDRNRRKMAEVGDQRPERWEQHRLLTENDGGGRTGQQQMESNRGRQMGTEIDGEQKRWSKVVRQWGKHLVGVWLTRVHYKQNFHLFWHLTTPLDWCSNHLLPSTHSYSSKSPKDP